MPKPHPVRDLADLDTMTRTSARWATLRHLRGEPSEGMPRRAALHKDHREQQSIPVVRCSGRRLMVQLG